MEAIYSFQKSVDFQRTTRRYNPEDSTLQIIDKMNGRTGDINIQINTQIIKQINNIVLEVQLWKCIPANKFMLTNSNIRGVIGPVPQL
jgi:hypothetical protein